jgi:4-hydroxy-tetrahydrodipicolinate reductase
MTRIAIAGAAGRMGRRIAALAAADDGFEIVSATESAGHEALGSDLGPLCGAGEMGVTVTEEMAGDPEAIIDFTTPESTLRCLDAARGRKIAHVIGTTGLTESHLAEIAEAAERIPVVQAPNMSVGVNLLFRIVGEVAAALGDDYDIEIAETHHRFKKDAPSGTALGLARSICEATGRALPDCLVHGRQGPSPRRPGEIGMHALRVGDTVGEHSVHFGSLGETVTISHSAHTRDTFALGALRAAAWATRQRHGLFSMQDVLFADK